jgi:3-hydroxy-5-phosphonooxypentane-2,4-dione thiolase
LAPRFGSELTLEFFLFNQTTPMPEADQEGQRYATAQRQEAPGFYLKGSHQLDWGMKNRLARVFDPASGRTVMLAVDHGYFQGPTSGLERIDLSIVPLLPFCDALFCTRGICATNFPTSRSRWIWTMRCA